MQVKELIRELKTYSPDEEVAYILWTRADIRGVGKENFGVELSNLECDEILADMHNHSDAEYGMTWITVDTFVDDHIRINKEVE